MFLTSVYTTTCPLASVAVIPLTCLIQMHKVHIPLVKSGHKSSDPLGHDKKTTGGQAGCKLSITNPVFPLMRPIVHFCLVPNGPLFVGCDVMYFIYHLFHSFSGGLEPFLLFCVCKLSVLLLKCVLRWSICLLQTRCR